MAEVGRTISSLLGAHKQRVWQIAQRIHIAYPKLQQIVRGEELPNGPQLHLIANFLGVSPELPLGIPNQPASADTASNPETGTEAANKKLAA